MQKVHSYHFQTLLTSDMSHIIMRKKVMQKQKKQACLENASKKCDTHPWEGKWSDWEVKGSSNEGSEAWLTNR